MPPDIVFSRIKSFTLEYQNFIMSDFTDEAIRQVRRSLNKSFNETTLENGIFLYLTLFLNKFSLTEFIITECHQTIQDAMVITSIILNMLPEEMVKQQINAALALELSDGAIKESDRFMMLESNKNLLSRYLYLKTTNICHKLTQKYPEISDELEDTFITLLADVVLGFYKIEDTVLLLQQELGLDAKTAALLGAEVLDFLAPLSDHNWQPPTDDDADGDGDVHDAGAEEQIPTVSSVPVAPQPQTHPTVIIHTPAPIPEIRTMASDMVEERSPARPTYSPITTPNEPVYVSTQPTITKKVSDVPSYTAPLYQPPKPNIEAALEKSRWG